MDDVKPHRDKVFGASALNELESAVRLGLSEDVEALLNERLRVLRWKRKQLIAKMNRGRQRVQVQDHSPA